jgi:hypothetical protein
MTSTVLKSFAAIGASIALVACTTVSPHLDAAFGLSVEEATDLQIMDPLALFDPNPVVGMDGVSAVSAIRHYQSTFATPQAPANVFAIGPSLGSALGGSTNPGNP